ncbi:Alpha- and gamma-adaptin-binding protein p34, partial [Globisporangium splendens]
MRVAAMTGAGNAPLPLTSAAVVCRKARPSLDALAHVVDTISAFLDESVSPRWTIPRASASNFPHLLVRLAAREPKDMDPHYKMFLSSRALVHAVANDNLEIVQWLCQEYCPKTFVFLAVEEAARLGNTRISVWLVENCSKTMLWSPRIMDIAAAHGQLETLQWLQTLPENPGCTRAAIENAARNGHVNVVVWLQHHAPVQQSSVAIVNAIECGHLEVVRFLHDQGHALRAPAHAIACAAKRNRLDILQWMHEHYAVDWTSDAMDSAAERGHLQIVQWLHANRIEGCTTTAMNQAAANGHLDMVQWLHANRSEGCTAYAMDGAAGNGFFDVVKWLHENRSEGCTTRAMNIAATNGHLDIVQWLHANRCEGCTSRAMNGAASGGHLNVVKWLHETRSEGCTAFAMDSAAEYGHLDVVQWLHANRTEGCTTAAMNLAASRGHLHVIQWLHENRTEGCTSRAMDLAVEIGHFHVVKWLHEHRLEGCTVFAMDCAHSLEILKWLHENRSEGCTTNAMRNAVLEGDFERLLFLHANRSEGCGDSVTLVVARQEQLEMFLWLYEHYRANLRIAHIRNQLPGIITEGRKLRGTFCAEWLPYMTSTADGWLLDSNGSPYKLAHSSLPVETAQLGDILRWEWIRPGVLNFIPTCGISRFSRPSIRALERLCATLVSNFPQLLYRPQQTNVLRLYNGQRHYNHEWHLHTSEATLTHVDTTLVKATHTVHSAMGCDIMATRDLNGQKVSFHAHPRFTRIVQLWGGNGRYNTTRSFYRQQVAATRTQIGKDTRDAAVNKAVQTAGSLWPGLQLIQWSELHNIPGITEKADLSCSDPECSQVVQSSVQHLFWECPKAKLVWNYFYALWAKIGITPGHDPAIWIFSLDLPDTPRHAWTTIKRHIIGHKFSNEHLQDHLYPVAHMLWRYMSASLIQVIWCAHLRRMDSDPIESTAEMAITMTRLEAGMRNLTRLAEAQAGDSDGHTVAAVLKAYVDCFLSQTDTIPLTPSDTRGVYLLFFDGGSRGNPGPGGTGSIIVRVHKDSHTASLIWAASMAYSRKDTTNNFAEYWGLIHGLREAQRSHFEPLYVIGDSALIISKQRMHRSPRQHRLARLYQTSRRLADCIDIRGWYHHYRAFNEMADSAANLAMDTRTSTQVHFPTQRAAFNNLTQDLDNDVMHWLMRSSEDPRSLDNTRQPHIGPREHAILVKDYLAVGSDLVQSSL